MSRLFCLLLSLAAFASPAMGQQDNEEVSAPTAEQLDFFEKRIRPVLVQHCYNCHSKKAAAKDELRGGLLLDSRVGFLAGGDSGAALVPGNPEEGTLLSSLNYDLYEMPPAGKLPPEVIADFKV